MSGARGAVAKAVDFVKSWLPWAAKRPKRLFTSVISPTPRLVRVVDRPDGVVQALSVGTFDTRMASLALHGGQKALLAPPPPPTSSSSGASAAAALAQTEATRVLSVEEFGDPNGRPIFWNHTEVGSRVSASLLHRPAFEYGLRFLCVDRPGHGLSSPNPRAKTLTDWPADVAAVADALQIKRFGVAGWSGGAPYALACAAKLPQRVQFASVLSGWGPSAILPPNTFEQLTPSDRRAARVARWVPTAYTLYPAYRLAHGVLKRGARAYMRAVHGSASAVDQRVLDQEAVLATFADDLMEAFRQGYGAAAVTAYCCYRPWGFELSAIPSHIPVSFTHGDKDFFIPIAVGEYLHRCVPHSVWHPLIVAGHFYPFEGVNQQLQQAAAPSHRQQEATATATASNARLRAWLAECRDFAKKTKHLPPAVATAAAAATAAV